MEENERKIQGINLVMLVIATIFLITAMIILSIVCDKLDDVREELSMFNMNLNAMLPASLSEFDVPNDPADIGEVEMAYLNEHVAGDMAVEIPSINTALYIVNRDGEIVRELKPEESYEVCIRIENQSDFACEDLKFVLLSGVDVLRTDSLGTYFYEENAIRYELRMPMSGFSDGERLTTDSSETVEIKYEYGSAFYLRDLDDKNPVSLADEDLLVPGIGATIGDLGAGKSCEVRFIVTTSVTATV